MREDDDITLLVKNDAITAAPEARIVFREDLVLLQGLRALTAKTTIGTDHFGNRAPASR
jgi:hypothetical protein